MYDDDILLIAMTRPAVYAGIPLEAAGAIMMLGMLVFAVTGIIFWALGVAVPLYFAARMITHYDMNAFRLLGLYLKTNYGQALIGHNIGANKKMWGGNSYSPSLVSFSKRKGFGCVQVVY